MTAGTIGVACYAMLGIFFADVVGRRRFLTYLVAARAVAGFALVSSTSFPLLAVVLFLSAFSIGGAGGAIQPLAQAMLVETADSRRRNDLFSVYGIFATVGTALGTLAAGFPALFQHLLGVTELESFRLVVVGYAVINLIAAVLTMFLSPAVEVSQKGGGWVNPLTLPARSRILKIAGVLATEHFGAALVLQSLVAYWFFTRFGVQLQSLAILFFVSNIAAAIAMWLGAKVANRIGLIKSIVFTHLPSGLMLLAMPFMPNVWLAIAVWLLYSLLQRVAGPLRQSFVMAIVAPKERVAMATLNGLGGNGAMATGPTVATILYGVASGALPFIVSGIVQMGGDVYLYFAFRKVSTPEEAHRRASRAVQHVEATPATVDGPDLHGKSQTGT